MLNSGTFSPKRPCKPKYFYSLAIYLFTEGLSSI
jgi:hypothetical protein